MSHDDEIQTASFQRASVDLYPARKEAGESLLKMLFKAAGDETGVSAQGVSPGMKAHPFDMRMAMNLTTQNIHHSRCLEAKKASHVGLGWSDPKVGEILDPLCDVSFWETLSDASMDYHMLGVGYLEVVRRGADLRGPIVGLHHAPAADVKLIVEDARRRNVHYTMQSLVEGGQQVPFARFGDFMIADKDRQKEILASGMVVQSEGGRIHELIRFRMPSSLSRWYSVPPWISATVSMEVVQMLHQHTFDYFQNRGVPEFILFVTGGRVKKEDWKVVTDMLKSNVGLGNGFKSGAVNLDNPELKAELVKLASEGGNSEATTFGDVAEPLALDIVSAHGVPPLLAGIQIPGKLGANNELPNALMAFQALVIGQAQMQFEKTLANTLGNAALNGGLGLSRENFLGRYEKNEQTGQREKKGGLVTILDAINVGMADTVGRMRSTLPEAQAEGRDLQGGVKD